MREKLKTANFKALQKSGDVLEGVVIIEKGIAKGHFAVEENGTLIQCDWDNPDHLAKQKFQIFVDETMLEQILASAQSEEWQPSKLKHGIITDTCGAIKNFRLDGDKVRGDWHPLNSKPEDAKFVYEIAEKFPSKFGCSVDYIPYYEKGTIEGKQIALTRCRKLSGVDIVEEPAAVKSFFNELKTINKEMTEQEIKLFAQEVGKQIATQFASIIKPKKKPSKFKKERMESEDKPAKKDEDEDEKATLEEDDDSEEMEDEGERKKSRAQGDTYDKYKDDEYDEDGEDGDEKDDEEDEEDENDDEDEESEDKKKVKKKSEMSAIKRLTERQKLAITARVLRSGKFGAFPANSPQMVRESNSSPQDRVYQVIKEQKLSTHPHAVALAKKWLGQNEPETYAKL